MISTFNPTCSVFRSNLNQTSISPGKHVGPPHTARSSAKSLCHQSCFTESDSRYQNWEMIYSVLPCESFVYWVNIKYKHLDLLEVTNSVLWYILLFSFEFYAYLQIYGDVSTHHLLWDIIIIKNKLKILILFIVVRSTSMAYMLIMSASKNRLTTRFYYFLV